MSYKSLKDIGKKQHVARVSRVLENDQQRPEDPNDAQENIVERNDVDEIHFHEEVEQGIAENQNILRNESFEEVVAANNDRSEANSTYSSQSSSDESIQLDSDTGSDTDGEGHADAGNRDRGSRIDENRPLYRGAGISVGQSMLLILALLLHHNLTMECIADIIVVLEFHCLSENLVKNSLHKFRRFFNISDNVVIKHYYCSKCMRLLQSSNDYCLTCNTRKNSYFVQLSITEQLQQMFSRKGFYNQLQTKFQRPPAQAQNYISDIYGGELYQEWMQNGFLSDPRNLSFTWYTDGVPVFKSPKISMWPVYLTINELPFEERKKRENTLLLGVWFDNKKPSMNSFFLKFREELKSIYDGIEIHSPDLYGSVTVKGVLLMGVCDLPAKCECLNFKQYNGEYGCPVCLSPGQTLQLETGGNVHIYPFTNQIDLRTLQGSLQHANIARPNNPEKGVKGPTIFSKLMPDFIRGMGIDRMHGADGGVLKKLMTLWFDPSYKNFAFSLYNVIDVINARLESLKPPQFIHRMPRSVSELIHWKSSELKHFLFYYSIPIFEGIMRRDYFEHYLRFVFGLVILSSEQISEPMLFVANDLLTRFVQEFEIMYGLRYCSINIHLLLHYATCVKLLGPLWAYSCYEYENLNGLFLKQIHGTRGIDTQIVRSQNQFLKMITFLQSVENEAIKNFCLKKKKQLKIIEQLQPHCYSIGVYKVVEEILPIIENALRNSNIFSNDYNISLYYRLLKERKLFVSELYSRAMKTQSSAALFFHNQKQQLGLVHCFVKLFRCTCLHDPCNNCKSEHYAIIKEIQCDSVFVAAGNTNTYNSSNFLYKCHESGKNKAVPIKSLVTTCFYMNFNNQVYIVLPINNKELE